MWHTWLALGGARRYAASLRAGQEQPWRLDTTAAGGQGGEAGRRPQARLGQESHQDVSGATQDDHLAHEQQLLPEYKHHTLVGHAKGDAERRAAVGHPRRAELLRRIGRAVASPATAIYADAAATTATRTAAKAAATTDARPHAAAAARDACGDGGA